MKGMGVSIVACAIVGLTAAIAAEPAKEARTNTPAPHGGEIFQKADANGDGAVTLEEIHQLAPKFPAERFKAIDRNNDGRLDSDEAQHVRRAALDKAGSLFKRADTNVDGRVTLDEFRAIAPKITESRFNQLDRNGDGGITLSELQRQNPAQTASDPAERIRKADQNGDGSVSFDELKTRMPGLTQERFAHMDRNNDGVLSPADRGDSSAKNTAGKDSRAARAAAARKLTESDSDKDGTVTYEEAVAAKPGFPRAAFDRYDTNGDGVLSSEDYAGK